MRPILQYPAVTNPPDPLLKHAHPRKNAVNSKERAQCDKECVRSCCGKECVRSCGEECVRSCCEECAGSATEECIRSATEESRTHITPPGTPRSASSNCPATCRDLAPSGHPVMKMVLRTPVHESEKVRRAREQLFTAESGQLAVNTAHCLPDSAEKAESGQLANTAHCLPGHWTPQKMGHAAH